MLINETRSISKEEYDKLKKMNKEEVYKYIYDIACKSYHPAGYGFSHPYMGHSDAGYFVTWVRGSTCD